jgi:regulation of enolase protein 1 (concanavalin A-like superfamily)
MLISSDGKAKFRRRTASSGVTLSDGPSAGTTSVPRWVKLTRRANVFSAFVSADGTQWTPVHTPQPVSMASTVEAGFFALRNHGAGLASARFDTIRLSAPLGGGWSRADIGAVGVAGSTTFSGTSFTLSAGGTALWDTSDAFHTAYLPWTGDGTIVARLDALTEAAGSTATLGGLMMRETLDDNARHFSMIVTTEGKAKFRRRLTTAGTTLSDGPAAGTIDVQKWVKLVRSGDAFNAYLSSDGVDWNPVGVTQSLDLPRTIYVGLMTLRSGGSARGTAKFTDVTVR